MVIKGGEMVSVGGVGPSLSVICCLILFSENYGIVRRGCRNSAVALSYLESKMKKWLLATAAAATFAFTANAASALTLVNLSMPGATTGTVSAPGKSGDFYIGPAQITFDGMAPIFGFCVGFYQEAVLGNQSIAYHNETFTNDYNGNPLSLDTVQRMASLANYALASNDIFKEQAAQLGIWGMEYSGLTWNTGNASLDALATTYRGWMGKVDYMPTVFAPDVVGSGQPWLTGTVPEPATWAMMIVGFGLIGATLRRRRSVTSYA
jgi:hypothetical protein